MYRYMIFFAFINEFVKKSTWNSSIEMLVLNPIFYNTWFLRYQKILQMFHFSTVKIKPLVADILALENGGLFE